jgi:hypothetical protein
MTEAKQKLDSKIATMVEGAEHPRLVARRLFLYDFVEAFATNQDRGFQILNTICEHFKLPFSAVKVVGSAQTGYSYYKERDFVSGQSDLDVAIISATLFQEYSHEIYSLTERYTDLTRFHRKKGISVAQYFRDNLASGLFRPDLMPECKLKADWFSFFNKLSNNYVDLFSNINAGIYLSEAFFECKHLTIIDAYRKGRP